LLETDIAQVQRIGPQHQAGSDSLLTASVFFRIRSTYFNNDLDNNYYANVLYGFLRLAGDTKAPSPTPAAQLLSGERPY
jgi:CCR4-NOT transcription complex subunit 7/8